MSFIQISLNIDSYNAEALSERFLELGALSATIEDQYEGTELEQPIFNEPGQEADSVWQFSTLTVLFEEKTNIDKLVVMAERSVGQKLIYTVSMVDDQDWVKLTQDQFSPIKITDSLYIVPSWSKIDDATQTDTAKQIILDPGLAFGTGSHPTTFMCLQWLANNVLLHKSVLDYGCGSGILAITAKKLGYGPVYAVDIDLQAIEASKNNAAKNGVDINIFTPDELVQLSIVTFDTVVANILSNPLRMLAPMLAAYTKTTLLLSGILESQADELSQIYSKWFGSINIASSQDGWVLLELTQKRS